MSISRRQFVRQGAAVTAGFVGLQRLLVRAVARGSAVEPDADLQPYLNEVEGYGPLVTDPKQIMDLPKGFSYKVLSRSGMKMDDGFLEPALPDGMAPVSGPERARHPGPQSRTAADSPARRAPTASTTRCCRRSTGSSSTTTARGGRIKAARRRSSTTRRRAAWSASS